MLLRVEVLKLLVGSKCDISSLNHSETLRFATFKFFVEHVHGKNRLSNSWSARENHLLVHVLDEVVQVHVH